MNTPTSAKRITALLLCVMLAAAFLLPITVHARESSKTVRVGWYESPFNMTDRFGRRSGLTVDQESELDCLKIGAMDFIPKPYPDIEIVKAHIKSQIKSASGSAYLRMPGRWRMLKTGLNAQRSRQTE